MFIFGSQYLRGAAPARDQWARDMENMKKLGFNTIRGWMVWNAVEPHEGEIDYDYVSTFLNTAEQFDLNVGLLFHMHACPMWAIKKFSKYFYIAEDGLPFEPAVRANTPSGGWPGLCYDNDEVRELEARFISGVVGEAAKHKNVAFYEPMNEPHQWVDYTKHPSGIFCYCPASVKKFQSWLEKKYTDIDTLNHAWGHFYGSFDEIRPPRWTNSYTDYADFRTFNMDNVVEEITYRRNLIKAADPARDVIAHAWGGGAVTCVQLGGMAFDDWKNAQVFDKWGYSAFPQRAEDCASLGLGSDATRNAAMGKEYWQSELTAGLVGTGLNQMGRVSDDTFYKFSLESIRHGAKGLLYWQYRKERSGSEFGGFSMTDYAGGPTNLTRCAGKLGEMLQRNGDALKATSFEQPKVALVFSIRSFLTDWSSSGMTGNKFAVDSMSGYYRCLWEENIPVDVIHEDIHGDLGQYRLIILSSPYAVSPKLAEELKAYMANGGTVLSDPYFGAWDENMLLSEHVPGLGWNEIFGCEEDDLTTREAVTLHGKKTVTIAGGKHMETFRDVTGRAVYTYDDGTPALIEKPFGKGRAILSGVNLGLSYSSRTLVSDDFTSSDEQNNSLGAKEIVLDICREVGIESNKCSSAGIQYSLLKGEKTDFVIMINYTHAEQSGEIELGTAFSGLNIELGTVSAQINGTKLAFTIPADKSAVLRFEH